MLVRFKSFCFIAKKLLKYSSPFQLHIYLELNFLDKLYPNNILQQIKRRSKYKILSSIKSDIEEICKIIKQCSSSCYIIFALEKMFKLFDKNMLPCNGLIKLFFLII
jgi:hypothetical protein